MSKSSNVLNMKDLINVGIFTALYIAVSFTTAMLGFIPIFMVVLPVILAVVCGIPYMLYMTKVKKFGMISITGTILGLSMLVSGNSIYVLITGITCGIIADLIMKVGNYQSKKLTLIAHGLFSEWLMGAIVILFFKFKEPYLESIVDGYGQTYVDALSSLTPDWLFFALIILTFIGGIIGGLLGQTILKKHFKKAGIV